MDSPVYDTISINEGQDIDIPDRKVLPYKHIEPLGSGGRAFVDKVQDVNTGEIFARKTFRKYYGIKLETLRREFQCEVSIIRRLSLHPHMIRVFATYTCGRELGMILSPVADGGDLASYLQSISDSGNPPTTEQRAILEQAFGCLASGLAFIHKETIRHKDIKPHNILIHQGLVLYTDFGIAADGSQYNNTTTTGTTYTFTFRYCAPEVANSAKRNRKSDVFSLGCVFIEMLAVLESGLDLEEFELAPYHTVTSKLLGALNRHKMSDERWRGLLGICINMLEPRLDARISSRDLLRELRGLYLQEYRGNSSTIELFCDACAPKIAEEQLMGSEISWLPNEFRDQKMHSRVDSMEYKWKLIRTLESHFDRVSSLAFSPNGKLLASGSWDATVRLWDPATGQARRTLEGHKKPVHAVTFSPDGKLLASGSGDNTIGLWDPQTGEARGTIEGHRQFVTALAFSPDSKLLASGSNDNTVRLWDPTTRQECSKLKRHFNCITTVAFSPDGTLLASGSDDNTVRLWNTATGLAQCTLLGHSNSVNDIAFSPDGKLLASGSDDATVRLWDPATGEACGVLKAHLNIVCTVAFSPDGKLLASGSGDRTVKLWKCPRFQLES